jgi:RNase P/RNase MRP subunit p30
MIFNFISGFKCHIITVSISFIMMENQTRMCSEFKEFCYLLFLESVNNKCLRQTATESNLRLLLFGELDKQVLLSCLK